MGIPLSLCPFCDSAPEQPTLNKPFSRHFQVFCDNCGARGPMSTTIEEAANEWNSRIAQGMPSQKEISDVIRKCRIMEVFADQTADAILSMRARITP